MQRRSNDGRSSDGVEPQRRRMFGLDVVRATAILLVLAAHLTKGAAYLLAIEQDQLWHLLPSAGFLGVEIFFVLSGFLIGRIILGIASQTPSRHEWTVFLQRRWARTIPLYAVWLAILVIVAPPDAHALRTVMEVATFTQALAWPASDENWFGIAWSLAVEEWFYLLFVLTVAGLIRARRRDAVQIACVLFLVLPLIARFTANGEWDASIRKVTLLRLDAIAYGVAASILWRRFEAVRVTYTVPLAMAGLATLLFLLDTVAAMALTPVARLFAFNVASVGTALCLPLLAAWRGTDGVVSTGVTWLSTRSYGLYLAHYPIMQATFFLFHANWFPGRWAAVASMLIALCIVTEFLYQVVEAPAMRRRPMLTAPAAPSLRDRPADRRDGLSPDGSIDRHS